MPETAADRSFAAKHRNVVRPVKRTVKDDGLINPKMRIISDPSKTRNGSRNGAGSIPAIRVSGDLKLYIIRRFENVDSFF
jgi:hypothetical protein